MKLNVVTLNNLGGGVLAELFEHELAKVLQDIDDPNTPAKKTRKIMLEVTFAPAENRESAQVLIESKVKLAGLNPAATLIHLAHQGPKLVALGADPNQMNLPLDKPSVVGGGAKHAES